MAVAAVVAHFLEELLAQVELVAAGMEEHLVLLLEKMEIQIQEAVVEQVAKVLVAPEQVLLAAQAVQAL
jgi:hypothetical protein